MTDRYVGPGGSDGNDGLSWANRKLTLNGVEDTPVVAGDTIYVGPGVYRELLTCDVSGSSGNVITYIADITGENTDGIGGDVRITGSDNDQTETRAECIDLNGASYRTFRGFLFDLATSRAIDDGSTGSNIIIEDCCSFGSTLAEINGSSQASITLRRCMAVTKTGDPAIYFLNGTVVNNTGHLVENCLFIGGADGVRVDRIGGITIKNCTFISQVSQGVRVAVALDTGQTVTVNNSILFGIENQALDATVTGELVEDFNAFYGNGADRVNVSVGSNSQTYPPLFALPRLLDGFRFPPPLLGELSRWSAVRAIAGSSEASDDLLGFTRPTTSAKKSWGAFQFASVLRDTGTVRSGSASLSLPDAGRVQIKIPVTAVSTTISVYVRRETNYAGTNPQMIIKQPGVADRATTDAGSSGSFNQLTDTFTPDGGTDFVIVELVSNNTATSGSYVVYFDDLAVN